MNKNIASTTLQFHLCENCAKTPQPNDELPFIDQMEIEGSFRDKGRISKCKYCGHPFLEYDIDYQFYGSKKNGKGFEATDWIPLTNEEAEIEQYRLHIQHIVTTRDHLYRKPDGKFAWRRLAKAPQPENIAEAIVAGLNEKKEWARRRGQVWFPAWDEMDEDERRDYMDYLENIAAEEKYLSPALINKSEDVKITTEGVKNIAQALGQLNPSAEEICWGLGIHKPSQTQIEIVDRIMLQERI